MGNFFQLLVEILSTPFKGKSLLYHSTTYDRAINILDDNTIYGASKQTIKTKLGIIKNNNYHILIVTGKRLRVTKTDTGTFTPPIPLTRSIGGLVLMVLNKVWVMWVIGCNISVLMAMQTSLGKGLFNG